MCRFLCDRSIFSPFPLGLPFYFFIATPTFNQKQQYDLFFSFRLFFLSDLYAGLPGSEVLIRIPSRVCGPGLGVLGGAGPAHTPCFHRYLFEPGVLRGVCAPPHYSSPGSLLVPHSRWDRWWRQLGTGLHRVGAVWLFTGLNCVLPQIHMFKYQAPVPQNVALFRNKTIVDVTNEDEVI